MDLEISEPTNVIWLQFMARHTKGPTAIRLLAGRPQNVAGVSSAIVLQPLPMLDWPANLFDDACSCH